MIGYSSLCLGIGSMLAALAKAAQQHHSGSKQRGVSGRSMVSATAKWQRQRGSGVTTVVSAAEAASVQRRR
jgi:hypothetical protein